MPAVGRPSFSLRTTPRKRQTAPSLSRAARSSEATSMGEEVRYIGISDFGFRISDFDGRGSVIGLQIRNSKFAFRNRSSSARHGRKKNDLIIVGQRAVGGYVFAVHGRWWHRRERGKPRNLRAQLRPQLPDAGSVGHFPLLLVPAPSLAKRRKIKQMDPHESSQ